MDPSEHLADALIDFAWSQWTALGVRGAVSRSLPLAAVGLEELMLLTSQLADHDPRLRDEAVDWCADNVRFISKPKLKGLLKSSPDHVQRNFAPWIAALDALVGGNWPGAANSPSWTPIRTHKSEAPELARPELVNLRLRALFGVGARADILTALLPWPAPDFAARDLVFVGYTKRNVAATLDWLSESDVLGCREQGNQRRFFWQRREQLVDLVQPLPGRIPRWPHIVRVLSGFAYLMTTCRTKSERMAAVSATKGIAELRPDLDALQMTPPVKPPVHWPTLRDWILREVDELAAGRSKTLAAGAMPNGLNKDHGS